MGNRWGDKTNLTRLAPPRPLPAAPVVIFPASLVQLVVLGLAVVSCGSTSLALWGSARERFGAPSLRVLRSSVQWTGAEPAYVWATLYVVFAAILLAGVAFGVRQMVTVSLCLMPLPFAFWIVAFTISGVNDPKASILGISAYAVIATVHVVLATVWLFMLRLNPRDTLVPPRQHVVDDVSSRHPVALSFYVAMMMLGLLLGPLIVGSPSLDDVLTTALQWQWSIEMMIGGACALVGAVLPLSRRVPGLFLERVGDVALVFGCLSYAAAIFTRSGLVGIGPALLVIAGAIGFMFRAIQITLRIHRVRHFTEVTARNQR